VLSTVAATFQIYSILDSIQALAKGWQCKIMQAAGKTAGTTHVIGNLTLLSDEERRSVAHGIAVCTACM
jgi:hypothetical protein